MAKGGDPASWEQNFKLDVLGMVNAFDAAKPFLEKAAAANGDAAFVIISSVSAAETDNASSYGPIKAALIHYAKGLARQYAKKGIRTNVVSPGMVYFEGGVWHNVEKNMPDYFKQALARNPTGRCATPQDIANAAVFLASPASSYTRASTCWSWNDQPAGELRFEGTAGRPPRWRPLGLRARIRAPCPARRWMCPPISTVGMNTRPVGMHAGGVEPERPVSGRPSAPRLSGRGQRVPVPVPFRRLPGMPHDAAAGPRELAGGVCALVTTPQIDDP